MTGALLSLADLDRVASLYREPTKRPSTPCRQSALDAPAQHQGALPTWAAVYAGCDALRSWASTANGLPEPYWFALAGIVGRCKDGRAAFHDLSSGDDRYDPAETDAKLDHALVGAGPHRCETIQDAGGDCADCPFTGRLSSPLSLGYGADAATIRLARRWAYVAAFDGFIEFAAGAET